jgi:hypothetical protein
MEHPHHFRRRRTGGKPKLLLEREICIRVQSMPQAVLHIPQSGKLASVFCICLSHDRQHLT